MIQQWQLALNSAQKAPRCGARTRKGSTCQSPAMANSRCRMHGGKSPGAPCDSGHGMYKHGRHTKMHLAMQSYINGLIKKTDSLITALGE